MADDSASFWARLRTAAGPSPTIRPDYAAGNKTTPRPYILEPGIAAAAEIAIRLAQPLLLTGEPGTGKTQFAVALAHHLGLPLIRCNVRSTTTVSDLFYGVDEVSRFRDAQPGSGGLLPFQYYLSFNGLGLAVLFAGGPQAPLETVRHRLTISVQKQQKDLPPPLQYFEQLYPRPGFPCDSGCRVVVLLDEFDKSPRDTPNDMLSELEFMRFEIAELGVSAAAPRALRPITIITSNSERSLPDPFLRRCIYYDIKFPEDVEAGRSS
jgi:MoxR-like ATPase